MINRRPKHQRAARTCSNTVAHAADQVICVEVDAQAAWVSGAQIKTFIHTGNIPVDVILTWDVVIFISRVRLCKPPWWAFCEKRESHS